MELGSVGHNSAEFNDNAVHDTANIQVANHTENPEHYYDIRAGHILLGRLAVEQHLTSGGRSKDLRQLGEFLRSNEAINHRRRWSLDIGKLSNEEHLDRLRWLSSILPAPQSKNQKQLNEDVITRASYLGLVASPRQLSHPDRFGSLSNAFRQLGESDNNIRYHDLTTSEAIKYVKDVHDSLGRMPTERELNILASSDVNNYSYDVLSARIPGGLRRVSQELGYVVCRTKQDLLYWGVEYFVANDLQFPVQETLNLCASVKKGPGHANIKRKWAMNDFNRDIASQFETGWEKIENAYSSGEVPKNLYCQGDILSTLSSYLRYEIISEFIPNFSEKIRQNLSMDYISDDDFLAYMEKYCRNLNLDVISSFSEKYGPFRSMWRKDYIQSLRISAVADKKLELTRGTIEETEKDRMHDAIDITADYMIANNMKFLQRPSLSILQKYGLVPRGDEFAHLFHSNELFYILALDKYRQRRKEIEYEDEATRQIIDSFQQSTNLPIELFYSFDYSEGDTTVNRVFEDYIREKYQNGTGATIFENRYLSPDPLTPEEEDKRIAKFMVINEVLDAPIQEKVIICTLNRSRNFAGEITRKNQYLTAADVELKARELGVANLIYPSREAHFNRLKAIRRKRKNELSRKNYRKRKRSIQAS